MVAIAFICSCLIFGGIWKWLMAYLWACFDILICIGLKASKNNLNSKYLKTSGRTHHFLNRKGQIHIFAGLFLEVDPTVAP